MPGMQGRTEVKPLLDRRKLSGTSKVDARTSLKSYLAGALSRALRVRVEFLSGFSRPKTADLLESKFRNYEASLEPRAELENEPGV